VSTLLDTQIAVYAVACPERLTANETRIITGLDKPVRVSLVSAWEIAIKNGLPGRRDGFPFSTGQALALFRRSGFTLLPIEERHLIALETLPPRHGDPFDRLLVAQAIADDLRLVSRDRRIADYFAER
jgi:PIN domain nuclease of toxin-antitoxin system